MKKLRIGYIPISKDLSHPADRRRIVFFAQKDNHELVLDLNAKMDLLVLSEKVNKMPFIKQKKNIPLILDLIDSYLTPNSVIEDYMRSWFKFVTVNEKSHYLSNENIVRRLCRTVDAVICSTPEQKKIISNHNFNVHDILDSHSEFPSLQINVKNLKNNVKVFWEGLPYNLNGFKVIPKNSFFYNIVSDSNYYMYYGKLGKIKTETYINKFLNIKKSQFQLLNWSLQKIIETAKDSHIGILPLDIYKKMNQFKAENRLLIMWRLGLPVLASKTKAYSRVLKNCNNVGLINEECDWLKYTNSFEKFYSELLWQVEEGKKYLDLNHSDEILMYKWRKAVHSIL